MAERHEEGPDLGPSFRLRPEIRAALAEHGFAPDERTDPRRVRDALKAIYTFEIREEKLKHRERQRHLGPQPLDDYRARVRALRRKYRVLSVPVEQWIDQPALSSGSGSGSGSASAPGSTGSGAGSSSSGASSSSSSTPRGSPGM